MLYVISDFKNVCDVIDMPAGTDLSKLKKEFYALNQAGPNPHKYDTPEQTAWIRKIHEEEVRLVSLYGGDPRGHLEGDKPKEDVFAVSTFVGWLVKEKGANRVKYKSFCLVEFD